MKFIIRNDDVAYDTSLEEIKRFCEMCDKYGFTIIHAVIPIGEAQKVTSHRMNNKQIREVSTHLFSENKAVVDYLAQRKDLVAVHGLWHTHIPTEEEILYAKLILKGLGLSPMYFVPPFNEGKYPEFIQGLKVSQLSRKKNERLEDFLESGTPEAEIMYLHSWRFNGGWYSFEKLEECLKRLQ